jgi:hypothetical protein
VGKPLKKTHTWSGGTGVRTRDLPNVKWRARRLATVLGRNMEGNGTSFIPPEGGRAAEAFSLFSHTDGKIREGYGEDGCGRKVVGTERLILTQHSPYL